LEACIKTPALPTTKYTGVIVNGYAQSSIYQSYGWGVGGSGDAAGSSLVCMFLNASGTTVWCGNAHTLASSTEYHVVLVYTSAAGGTLTWYVNGVNVATQTGVGTPATPSGSVGAGIAASVGCDYGYDQDYGGGHDFAGSIEAAAYYAASLTSTQVTNHYNAYKASVSGPVQAPPAWADARATVGQGIAAVVTVNPAWADARTGTPTVGSTPASFYDWDYSGDTWDNAADTWDTGTVPVFTADTPTGTARVATAYSYTFVASGSPPPTYSLASGSLPPGLSLNATTGVLSGTPIGLGGVYVFEIQATNAFGSATTPVITLAVLPAQALVPVVYPLPITPHLALPLTVGPSGSFNVLVQDTLAEVTQSVSVLLGTMKGDRTMVPDYGVDDPTFATPNAGAITQAINQWEPRAAVVVTVSPMTGNTQQSVNVQVALAAEASS
jgi:phage baseplate assembly protein W